MGFLSGEISLLRSMVSKVFLFFSRFGFFGSDGILEVKHMDISLLWLKEWARVLPPCSCSTLKVYMELDDWEAWCFM